jgi:predicted aconitase with swiveling domain
VRRGGVGVEGVPESSEVSIKCHKLAKGFGEGEALVSKEPICFYLVEPKTGVVREKGHQLEGKSVARKVLVFPTGKASSAVQMDGLVKLLINRNAPNAMIVTDVEPVLLGSAVLTKIPLVDRLEKNPFEAISSGDFVKVDADKGSVIVTKG